MVAEGPSLCGPFMDDGLRAQGGHGGFVKVKMPEELGVGGQFGVDARGSEHVECHYDLGNEAAP
jgi:hypothetical protein